MKLFFIEAFSRLLDTADVKAFVSKRSNRDLKKRNNSLTCRELLVLELIGTEG